MLQEIVDEMHLRLGPALRGRYQMPELDELGVIELAKQNLS